MHRIYNDKRFLPGDKIASKDKELEIKNDMEFKLYEWEVLMDYPGSPFKVGQIVLAYEHGHIEGIKYHGDGYGPYLEKIAMTEYPHVFKKSKPA
jgi:hypothetical protein